MNEIIRIFIHTTMYKVNVLAGQAKNFNRVDLFLLSSNESFFLHVQALVVIQSCKIANFLYVILIALFVYCFVIDRKSVV